MEELKEEINKQLLDTERKRLLIKLILDDRCSVNYVNCLNPTFTIHLMWDDGKRGGNND